MIIRNSARAIIIVYNKLLVTKMNNNGIFYLLPGSGQKPGELLTETLERECEEEIQYNVKLMNYYLLERVLMTLKHNELSLY